MVEKSENLCQQDDEIDLRELWAAILKRKSVPIIIVFVVTLASIIYVSMLKPVKPLYEANALVEIGKSTYSLNQNMSESDTVQHLNPIDTVYDLKNIIERVVDVNVYIPNKSTSLLTLSFSSPDKEVAIKRVQEGILFILERHKQMKDEYKLVSMSKIVGDIEFVNIAKQPKKKLIVTISFISSLIFSLFLVFFIEFVQGGKKEEKL